jgi:hypothetical protein
MYKWFKNVSSKTDNRLQGSRKFNGFVRVILLIPVFFILGYLILCQKILEKASREKYIVLEIGHTGYSTYFFNRESYADIKKYEYAYVTKCPPPPNCKKN